MIHKFWELALQVTRIYSPNITSLQKTKTVGKILLFTFLLSNLIFNHIFLIFRIFFGKYTLTHFLKW